MASVGKTFASHNKLAYVLYSAPWGYTNSTRYLQESLCSPGEPFLCPSWRTVNTTLNSILEKTSSAATRHQETETWFLFVITVVHWLSLLSFFGFCFIEYQQQIFSFVLKLMDPLTAWCSAVINRAAATIGRSHLGKKDVEIAALKLKLEDRLEAFAELEDILKHTRKCLARESRQYRETLANSRADLNVFRAHMKDFEARFGTMREDNRILVESVDELEAKVEDLSISNQILWVDNENLWGTNEDLARTNENWRKTMHAFQTPDPLKLARETQLAELQTAYNRVITSNIKLREENSHRIGAANAQAFAESQNKLNNALYEINMLRAEVLDKEKGIEQLTRKIQHIEVRLNTALSDVACRQDAPSLKKTKHIMTLKNESQLVQTLTARNHGLQLRNQRLEASLEKTEKESKLRTYVDGERAKYPSWESQRFGDEGFEEPAEEEPGYVSAGTVELSEFEDEFEEEFEEVLLENVKENFEVGTLFSEEERGIVSDGEDVGFL